MTGVQMGNSLYEDHQSSQKLGSTTTPCPSLSSEVEQSEASNYVRGGLYKPLKALAMLYLALAGNPAAAFAPRGQRSQILHSNPNRLGTNRHKDYSTGSGTEVATRHTEHRQMMQHDDLGDDNKETNISLAAPEDKQSDTDTPSFWVGSSKPKMLTKDEEVLLGRCVQTRVQWEATGIELESRLGRKATLDEWAAACNFASATEFSDALREARDAKERFILSNMGLVRKVANRYAFVPRSSLAYADLVQEGVLGLAKAVEKFDPERGLRFSTSAWYWIRSAMMQAQRNKAFAIRLPSSVQADLKHISRANAEFSGMHGRSPTDAELMELLNISKKKLAFLNEQRIKGSVPLSTDAQDWVTSKVVQANSESADTSGFMKSDVEAWLQTLPSQEREMLQSRFGLGDREPMSYVAMAEKFNTSRESVRKHLTRILRKMYQDDRYQDLRDYIGDLQ